MSFAGAQTVAAAYPQYATQILDAAKTSFLAGDTSAYLAGIVAVLIGAALVFFFYPKREQEGKMLAAYHEQDMEEMSGGKPK
jgi:hypothetical protein